MITALTLTDFKSFEHETLGIGPFTLIIGTNASGKSNLRDAFRFLHGLGRGYTLAEIIGGKYGAGGQVEWAPMRGAAREIIHFGAESFLIATKIKLGERDIHYWIEIRSDKNSRGGFRIFQERLFYSHTDMIYTSHPDGPDPVFFQDDDTHLQLRMRKTGDQKKYGARVAVRPDQPALTQIRDFKQVAKVHKDLIDRVIDLFAHIRFLDLVPDSMRKPSFPGQTVLGDSGENLPTVLQTICADPQRKAVLIDWLRELTPMDVTDLDFQADPLTGLVQMVIRETDDRMISAYSASDGTLRFLAMLAALLGTNPAQIYFFEEIDTGIHPSRLHLLVDLIERQTDKGGIQVVATTHSPALLAMIGDKAFENTSVVGRLAGAAGSIIRPVSGLPNAAALRTSQGLGRLHASGWMEDALAFTEADAADQDKSP